MSAQTAGYSGLGLYSPAYLEGSAWDRLELIDPGTADLGPLSRNTRVLAVPLERQHGFGLLYRAVMPDGQQMFARRDSGITALFPRSFYMDGPGGEVSLIPADTRFIIGEPAASFATHLGLDRSRRNTRDPSGGLQIDGRLDSNMSRQANGGRDWARPARDASPQRGVAALLQAAARRERAGGFD